MTKSLVAGASIFYSASILPKHRATGFTGVMAICALIHAGLAAPFAIACSVSLSPLSSTSARNIPFSFFSSSLGLPNSAYQIGLAKYADEWCPRTIRPASSTICEFLYKEHGPLGCSATHDCVRIHNRLQTVCDGEQSHAFI